MIDPNWSSNILNFFVGCAVTSLPFLCCLSRRDCVIDHLRSDKAFYKEKYEQLKLDQIQELLDDRDFSNND